MLATNELVPSSSLSEKQREAARLAAEVEAFIAAGGKIKTDASEFNCILWPLTDSQAEKALITVSKVMYLHAVSRAELLAMRKMPGFPVAYTHKGEVKFSRIEMREFLKKNNRPKVAIGADDDAVA